MVAFFKKTRTYMKIKKCYGEDDMEIGYEKKLDLLGIMLEPDYEYDTSVEVEAGFIIDLDKNNKLVAIEIVGCSKKIDETPDYVEKADIKVFVDVYEFSYKIIISFNDGEKEIVKRILK